MPLFVRIECDSLGCWNKKVLADILAEDVEFELQKQIAPDGKWLFDPDNESYYCPKHAPGAAEELGLEYQVSEKLSSI